MTRALGQHAGQPVRVQLLHQGRGRLLPDEARLLGTRGCCGQVREVVLDGGSGPLMAARTVHASRRLQRHPKLAALGSRALGELLFEHGRPRRLHCEHGLIDRRSPLHRLVRNASAGLRDRRHACRARRTVYRFERQPMLVTEVFLPALVGRSKHAAGKPEVRGLP